MLVLEQEEHAALVYNQQAGIQRLSARLILSAQFEGVPGQEKDRFGDLSRRLGVGEVRLWQLAVGWRIRRLWSHPSERDQQGPDST